MRTAILLICFMCFLLFFAGVIIYSQLTPIRVACIGDSITEGSFVTEGKEDFPTLLVTLLGAHYDVKNFGVSGTTMLKNGDHPYWNVAKFLAAQDFKPHIVIITLGTNDSKYWNWGPHKGEYYNDYLDMIQIFRNINKNVHIYACAPPPAFDSTYSINGTVIRDEIIPLVRMVRQTAGTDSINFYDAMLPYPSYFADGIHPNATGHILMANLIKDIILMRSIGHHPLFKYTANRIRKG